MTIHTITLRDETHIYFELDYFSDCDISEIHREVDATISEHGFDDYLTSAEIVIKLLEDGNSIFEFSNSKTKIY